MSLVKKQKLTCRKKIRGSKINIKGTRNDNAKKKKKKEKENEKPPSKTGIQKDKRGL